jgi:hypothetical protein
VSDARRLVVESTTAPYRRRIELRPEQGVVEASMEDYVHHVALRLHHDGTVVTSAEVATVRVPWSTCADGAAGTGRLGGVPLAEVADLTRWMGGRTHQCVHTTDLAVLAAAAAQRGRPTTYEVWLSGIGERRMCSRLLRDGEEWAVWTLVDGELLDEGRFAGLRLARRDFAAWIAAHLGPEDAEAASVLRRGTHIGLSRGIDTSPWEHPDDARPADDSCLTYAHGTAEVAVATIRPRPTEDDGPGSPSPRPTGWVRV